MVHGKERGAGSLWYQIRARGAGSLHTRYTRIYRFGVPRWRRAGSCSPAPGKAWNVVTIRLCKRRGWSKLAGERPTKYHSAPSVRAGASYLPGPDLQDEVLGIGFGLDLSPTNACRTLLSASHVRIKNCELAKTGTGGDQA